MARSIPAIAFLAALCSLGCGGGGFQAGNPWDPAESKVFDDGLDLIDDLSKLSGEWAYRSEEQLDARVNLADLVAVISINSVQTTENLEGAQAKRIEAPIARSLYGDSPSETLVLLSVEGSLGYPLVLRNEHRLVGRHIAFVRWFDDGASLGHHFHLSPASDQNIDYVERKVSARKREEERLRLEAQRQR